MIRFGMLLLVVLAPLVAGCGRWAVRPSEKEHLADRMMQLDYDTLEQSADAHVLSNREGSSGGAGTAGGGCGCN